MEALKKLKENERNLFEQEHKNILQRISDEKKMITVDF